MTITAEHTVETADGPMRLYEAAPERPRAAIVVLQEAFGVNDHIRDIANRLAAAGYHAVAPQMYHRSGGGTVAYGDYESILAHVDAMTDAGILVDLRATCDHLAAAGFAPPEIGMVGFCMGGRMTFLAAAEMQFGAAVGFYGGGIVNAYRPDSKLPSLLSRSGDLRTPWLGLFGDLDQGIPVDDVERLRHELSKACPVAFDIVRYPDARHGFHCDVREEYDAKAAADGWQRTLDWFERYLRHRSS